MKTKDSKADTLKTGMLVLVRDADDLEWMLDVFSHIEKNSNMPGYPFVCITDKYAECIPLEGNEHLLNTNRPANSLPVPVPEEPKLPKFNNEKKRYIVVFGNEKVNYTDQELYNFITVAVLRNRDIAMFTVIDTEGHPLSQID